VPVAYSVISNIQQDASARTLGYMITFLIVCVGRDLPESLLLRDALQRMLVFAGKVHNLRLRATYADYADGMGTTLLCV